MSFAWPAVLLKPCSPVTNTTSLVAVPTLKALLKVPEVELKAMVLSIDIAALAEPHVSAAAPMAMQTDWVFIFIMSREW
jgi:hypothetical protein